MACQDKKEGWVNAKWRPAMGWSYLAVNIFDFIIFPILWSVLQAYLKQPITAWKPLTLEGAGLFHMAMGAVLGVTAWGRTQEKLQVANYNATHLPPTPSSVPVNHNVEFNTRQSPAPMIGYHGKKAPPPSNDPVL